MYSASTDPRDQESIQERVQRSVGILRVVVVTVAFSMGIMNIPNIDTVIPRIPYNSNLRSNGW